MAKKPRRATESPAISPRAKLWIHVGSAPGLTDAGADLLEQIAVCGSLSEAARRLRFSYRRAWMLVDNMNRRWPGPLVKTAVGGKAGGGTQITDLGECILRTYRDLQIQLEHVLDQGRQGFEIAVKSA